MKTLQVFVCLTSMLIATTGYAVKEDCAALFEKSDFNLDDAVKLGCQMDAAQVSRLMDNPVGELASLPLQIDRLTVEDPIFGTSQTIETTKLIPTFPIEINKNWSFVNRLVIPHVRVPIDVNGSSNLGVAPEAFTFTGASPGDVFSGSTSGIGDLTYVGLFTPKDTVETKGGKIVWAIGPTLVLPTAEEDILGQGRYQAGPAFAVGYLGERWTIGALAQHWWSVGGDRGRDRVSQSNIQYFVYRKLANQWAIGASPNISVDWSTDDAPIVNAPIGIGINKTLLIGKLPMRIGLEATRYVVHEGNISPDWGLRLSITPVIPAAFLRNL